MKYLKAIIQAIKTTFNYTKLLIKYNTLENKYMVLKERTKENMFKQSMEILNKPYNIENYKKENKRLREIVKKLRSKEEE
jgi:uncharacterized membrane protein